MTARLETDPIRGSAETHILMSDFGVGPIRISFLPTEDAVRLRWALGSAWAGNMALENPSSLMVKLYLQQSTIVLKT